MNGHTPGPWKQGRHPHNIVATVEGYEEIVAQIGDMPCVSGHDDFAAERGCAMERANARLIAAAPDLLNALSVLADAAEEIGIPCDAARAAIAKATGETA